MNQDLSTSFMAESLTYITERMHYYPVNKYTRTKPKLYHTRTHTNTHGVLNLRDKLFNFNSIVAKSRHIHTHTLFFFDSIRAFVVAITLKLFFFLVAAPSWLFISRILRKSVRVRVCICVTNLKNEWGG